MNRLKDKMKLRLLCSLLTSAALAILSTPAPAQTAARVTGVVKSSAGQPVAGAKIKAVGQNRSQELEATSAEDGAFSLPELAADTYQISASAPKYSECAVVVEVGVGQARAIELKLNTLAEGTVIAVSKDVSVDLSSASLSVNVTPQEVSSMPLNGRSYSILTLLAPGAVNVSDGGFDKLSFSGQPTSHNRYSFDGIDAGSVIDPSPGWFPVVGTQFRLQTSIETIQEFRVDTALEPAEYGMGAGGHVNVVSRSGSGQVHGSLFENFRHSDLAARDFFAVGDGRLRMNQYGATVGGPIPGVLGKSRAFFFAAYERLGESSMVSGQGPVPTPTLMAISNPATARIIGTLPVLPAPDPATLIVLSERSGMSRLGEWNGSARLDFNLTDRNKLALRYVKAKQWMNTLDQTTVTPRYMLAHAAPDNALASWNGVFGTVFNELKFGLNRAPTGLSYATPFGWMSDFVALPGAQLSTWAFGGVGKQAGGDYGRAADYRGRSYSAIDTVTWNHGRHSVKAGMEVRAVRVPLSTIGGTAYSFSTAGFIADLGATVSYIGDLHSEAQQNLYGGFVQDEWRVRDDLSVNIGLRYEFFTAVKASGGQARVFDMNRLSFLPAGSAPYQASGMGLAPRLGLAWAPKALRSRTVLRLGGAVHNSPGQLRDFLGPIENAAPRFSADGLSYPADLNAAAAAGLTVQTPIGIDTSSRFADRVYQWGLSVQQILPAQFTAQAAYLGSAARDLITRRWGNLVTGATPYGSLLRQNPAFGEIPYISGGGSDNYHALQFQLNRRFAEDFLVGAQFSWSHNLTDTQSEGTTVQNPACLRCEKGPADFDVRRAGSLNVVYHVPLGRGSRHWNKGFVGAALAGWSAGALFSVRSGLPINVTLARSDISFMTPAGEVVSPGTPGAFPVLDTPAGGGTHGSFRPGVAAGMNPYLDSRLLVLNPAALTVPQLGAYGNLGRNALMGPGFSQLDGQATRTFHCGERTAVQLRADIYNALNHANFAPPTGVLVNVSPFIQPGEAFTTAQSANFGVISSTVGRNLGLGTSRQIQLGLRVSF
jgi:hypothetical protein